MNDIFIEREWSELCERVVQTAAHLPANQAEAATFAEQANQFCAQAVPQRYPELLDRVADAARLAKRWQGEREAAIEADELIDEVGEESFPASDPPAFSRAHA